MIRKTSLPGIALLLLGAAFLIGPAAAMTAAVYGSTSGFLPEQHTDQITVVTALPGMSGGLFDQSVADFTDPSVDIIFIGGDAEFSSQTAAAIEQAVWDGKVLVIGYPATARFGDSLPLQSGGKAEGGKSLVVTSLSNGIAGEVFAGTSKVFTAKDPVQERLAGTAKPGSVSLLKFNTGDPALVYREYGKGFVVEWVLASPETYLGRDDADSVNFRIASILSATVRGTGNPVTTVPTTAAPTTVPTTATPTAPATAAATPEQTTGSALIQSNPLGAGVYLDGIYTGKTPLQLEGVPAGYHPVRMTMNGFYDFDGSAYIVAGQTITVFGSLPAKETPITVERTVQPATPAPTTVPTTTAAPTGSASDPISNPTVIAAGIGIITAGIGAYATIYTKQNKDKKE